MLQQTLAILLVLALLAGTLFLLRRRGLVQFPVEIPRRANGTKQMQLIERLAITPQHSLHMVNVRDQAFLVGISPAGFQTLATFTNSLGERDVREAQ